MPCDSRIEVRIIDRDRFLRTLKNMGAEIYDGNAHVKNQGLSWRSAKDGSLRVNGPPALVETVQNSYAELSVQDWADQNGWTVETDTATNELVLRQWENS